MFVKVLLQEELPSGSVISYNTSTGFWDLASNATAGLFGVLETTVQDENLQWFGNCRLGNSTYALADRAIPDEGGFMNVVDGRVYVDNSNHNCGVVAPSPPGAPSRVAGDLVLIYLR